MKAHFVFVLAGLLLLGAVSPAAAQGRKLSDEELDKVTAAGASVEVVDGVLRFHYQGKAGRGHAVDAAGTVELIQTELGPSATTLLLRDNAQQNLRSFVNVNAVNSLIQVLINMTINIDSNVGTLRQTNLLGEN